MKKYMVLAKLKRTNEICCKCIEDQCSNGDNIENYLDSLGEIVWAQAYPVLD